MMKHQVLGEEDGEIGGKYSSVHTNESKLLHRTELI